MLAARTLAAVAALASFAVAQTCGPDYTDPNAGKAVTVPLVQGWYKNRTSWYYSFTTSSIFSGNSVIPIPIYVIFNETSTAPIQPNIVDKLPCDSGYSDLWSVTIIRFNDTVYRGLGTQLKSFADVDAQIAAKNATKESTSKLVNCPVYPFGSKLEALPTNLPAGVAGSTVNPTGGFYKGSSIFYFDAGDAPSSSIPIWVNMYSNKTSAGNNIIDSIVPEDKGYSPFWKPNIVSVPATYPVNSLRSANVVVQQKLAVEVKDAVVNCPVVFTQTTATPFTGSFGSGNTQNDAGRTAAASSIAVILAVPALVAAYML